MARKSKRTRQENRSYEQKINEPIAITPREYSGLQSAYDHFNKELFGGDLQDVFFTYQRKPHSDGHFAPDRFSSRNGKFNTGELALNPDRFVSKTDEQICQTLAQLMVQVWQHSRGTLPSRGYHDGAWAEAMKNIGLYPSSTGAPGGSETGQRMSSYILRDGRFSRAYAELAATGWELNLESAPRVGGKKKKDDSKTPFSCAVCGWNMWGKPDSKMTCTRCVIPVMEAELGAAAAAAIALVERYQLRTADASVSIAPAAMPTPLPLFEPPPSYEPTPSPSYDEIAPALASTEAESIKRKRGRPKGSKNRKLESVEQSKPRRGRPPKNKPIEVAAIVAPPSYERQPIVKRKRGRPKGSKNRPKELAA
jgi:hypothetical protein